MFSFCIIWFLKCHANIMQCRWCNGIMRVSQSRDPGSIPGRRNIFLKKYFIKHIMKNDMKLFEHNFHFKFNSVFLSRTIRYYPFSFIVGKVNIFPDVFRVRFDVTPFFQKFIPELRLEKFPKNVHLEFLEICNVSEQFIGLKDIPKARMTLTAFIRKDPKSTKRQSNL